MAAMDDRAKVNPALRRNFSAAVPDQMRCGGNTKFRELQTDVSCGSGTRRERT
jgi:hypothetical protein